MGVVLGFDDCDGDVQFVEEEVVGPAGLAPRHQLSTNDDPALPEAELLSNLHGVLPPSLLDGRRDELRADIPFGELFFIHWDRAVRNARRLHSRTDNVGPNKPEPPVE